MVSASKKPLHNYPDAGSLWIHQRGYDENDGFMPAMIKMQQSLLYCETENNVRRATKQEIEQLEPGATFYAAYLNQQNYRWDLQDCVKATSDTEGLLTCHEKEPDGTQGERIDQWLNMVNDDGSFIPSHTQYDDEDGYFFLKKNGNLGDALEIASALTEIILNNLDQPAS